MAAMFRQSPRMDTSTSYIPLSDQQPPSKLPAAAAASTSTSSWSTLLDLPDPYTDPLFPPLPVYGPATPLRRFHAAALRASSGVIGLCFLGVIVLGALAESLPPFLVRSWGRWCGRDPDLLRPFFGVEKERARGRRVRDELVTDIGYYARRVGLDAEKYTVRTEDGFLLELHHIFDPNDPPYYPDTQKLKDEEEDEDEDEEEEEEEVWATLPRVTRRRRNGRVGRRRYPVLLMHGLLQSAGAFCVNDEDSIAFYLVRCGYDVFLGENRCGFNPRHTVFKYSDPRMWSWNIRQMGIFDLPAFINPILTLSGFPKLALIAHSQGTTQTFVALAKQQRPELGEQISVFCALAPAVYAGPLINKFYFKIMRLLSPGAFRVAFGIHAFIPFMMSMHSLVPARLYGALGYRVFWFLFGWSDTRWDRGLRNRFFRFAPVYVSSETMWWWLGRECFAKHKCILSTRTGLGGEEEDQGSWFDGRFPPLAMWVAGADELVDGRRLLRRFEEGREPAVRVVWKRMLEDYEHLDVVWAVDARERVFKEVAGVVGRVVEENGGVEGGVRRRV